ncbi:MAG: hypothetical protein EAX86_02180 [Candidatus Heimdallarchaeota archaeon]|nr:hypothetical protein [Candidatus Heimdallarchaeota archaeon]
MENIANLQSIGSLENFALNKTEQFLKPRTPLDFLFLVLCILWWIIAVVFPSTPIFRGTIFSFAIVVFFLIPIYILFNKEGHTMASPLNRAFKLLLFYLLINFFIPSSNIPNFLPPSIPITYGEIERTIVCLLIPLTMLIKAFALDTLRIGYLFYIQSIIRGFWTAFIILFIMKGIQLFIPTPLINFDFDLFLLLAFGLYLFGSVLPGVPKQISFDASSFINQYQALQTRMERIRDALLTSAITLLIFLWLQWINLSNRELFQYIAFICLVMGILLIFAPKKKTQNGLNSLLSSLSQKGNFIDPKSQLGSKVQEYAKSIQAVEFNKPNQVYSIPSESLKLISKGKTSISANKGTLAVPTVTDKGTALVLMGKSEMTTEEGEKVLGETTTIWLPPEEWDRVKVNLQPKKMEEILQTDLKEAGLENFNDLVNKSKHALEELKSWKGPENIFSSVLDAPTSKYTITETKDYSLVRLPGIFVFEAKGIELVNILGGLVKVIEVKGVGEYVQILGGLVTVLDTPDYEFVQTPFVSVIDTPQGEMVRVFGINIQEGDKIDLIKMREKILRDQASFDSLFTQKIDTIFQENPQILLTESKGTTEGFLFGQDEILGDLVERSKKSKKKDKQVRVPPIPPIPPIPPKPIKPDKSTVLGKFQWTNQIEKVSSESIKEISYKRDISNDIHLLESDDKDSEAHPQIIELQDAIKRTETMIDNADERLISGEISEEKHTEIIDRLIKRKKDLEEQIERINGRLKLL